MVDLTVGCRIEGAERPQAEVVVVGSHHHRLRVLAGQETDHVAGARVLGRDVGDEVDARAAEGPGGGFLPFVDALLSGLQGLSSPKGRFRHPSAHGEGGQARVGQRRVGAQGHELVGHVLRGGAGHDQESQGPLVAGGLGLVAQGHEGGPPRLGRVAFGAVPQDEHDLALHVHGLVVVVLQVLRADAVAGEHQVGARRPRRGEGERTEVLAGRKLAAAGARGDAQGIGRADSHAVEEGEGLEVAPVCPARSKTRGLHLSGDPLPGTKGALGARAAPLPIVARQSLDGRLDTLGRGGSRVAAHRRANQEGGRDADDEDQPMRRRREGPSAYVRSSRRAESGGASCPRCLCLCGFR